MINLINIGSAHCQQQVIIKENKTHALAQCAALLHQLVSRAL
jgi:hypothetical protein